MRLKDLCIKCKCEKEFDLHVIQPSLLTSRERWYFVPPECGIGTCDEFRFDIGLTVYFGRGVRYEFGILGSHGFRCGLKSWLGWVVQRWIWVLSEYGFRRRLILDLAVIGLRYFVVAEAHGCDGGLVASFNGLWWWFAMCIVWRWVYFRDSDWFWFCVWISVLFFVVFLSLPMCVWCVFLFFSQQVSTICSFW